jgi:hypothetical protein
MIEHGVNAGIHAGFQMAILRLEIDEIHIFIVAGFEACVSAMTVAS